MDIICNTCRIPKDQSSFSADRRKKTGRQACCRTCAAAKCKEWRSNNKEHATNVRLVWEATHPQRHLNKYGITLADKIRIFAEQGSVCAACGSLDHGNPRYKGENGWCLDHCHDSNQVRGVLCWSCNVTLGHCKESVERLSGIIEYLRKNAARNTLFAAAGYAVERYAYA